MTGSEGLNRVWLVAANVWLALASPSHVHSAAARTWIGSGPGQLAFCRITQMALLRHLTNRTIMQEGVLSVTEAWSGLDRLRAHAGVIWLDEPSGIERLWRSQMSTSGMGASAWTDAYLAAFALAHDTGLVTFDRGFARFSGLRAHIL